jgi:hypothetical protein
MPKITERVVDALKPRGKPHFEWDSEIKGFGLRVMPTGVTSYVFQYRNVNRIQRLFTIGKHGAFAPDEARREAENLRRAVSATVLIVPAHERPDLVTGATELVVMARWTMLKADYEASMKLPAAKATSQLRHADVRGSA